MKLGFYNVPNTKTSINQISLSRRESTQRLLVIEFMIQTRYEIRKEVQL